MSTLSAQPHPRSSSDLGANCAVKPQAMFLFVQGELDGFYLEAVILVGRLIASIGLVRQLVITTRTMPPGQNVSQAKL